jgi:hypothetical protein
MQQRVQSVRRLLITGFAISLYHVSILLAARSHCSYQ